MVLNRVFGESFTEKMRNWGEDGIIPGEFSESTQTGREA